MIVKRIIFIIIVCLLLVLIIQNIGATFGYFNDTESSVDNILRFKHTW